MTKQHFSRLKTKPRKYRILLVQDFLSGTGGTENYVYSLKGLLEQDGHTVQLFGGLNEENFSSFISRIYSFKFYNKFSKVLKDFKPDIVHAHHIYRNLSPSVLIAAKRYGAPVVQTIHGYNFICPKVWMIDDKGQLITAHDSIMNCLAHHLPKKNIFYSIAKYLKFTFHRYLISRSVDFFICPSKGLYSFYEKRYPGRALFLPNFVQEQPRYSRLPKDPNLLFVGRLSYDKGVDILLKAFELTILKVPDAKLTIIGDGPEKEKLINYCIKVGLSDKVKFMGNINKENILDFYKDAYAVVLPSLCAENCPITAIEAVKSQRPIIASNVGGFLDIVKDNATGYLFKRGDSKDLSTKMIKLLNNPRLAKQFSLQQQTLINDYGPSAHLKNISQIYNMLMEI